MEDEIFTQELREAAWNVLHENPGIGFEEWKRILLEEYPSEVVDVLGTNQKKAMELLSDWWETEEYLDPVTDICCVFQEWSEYFANEKTVEVYDLLLQAKADLSEFDGLFFTR